MADKKKNIIPKKAPQKPSYQVWVIVALISVIIAVTYLNNSATTVKVKDWKEFETMVKKGENGCR